MITTLNRVTIFIWMSVSTEAWSHQCHLPPSLRAPSKHNSQRIKSSCQVMPDRTHRGAYQSYCNTSNYGCYPYSSSRLIAGCYARCSMIQWRCIPTCKAAERIVRKLQTEHSLNEMTVVISHLNELLLNYFLLQRKRETRAATAEWTQTCWCFTNLLLKNEST